MITYEHIIKKIKSFNVKSVNKNQLLMGFAGLAVVVTLMLVFAKPDPNQKGIFSVLNFSSSSANKIAQQAVDYLNANVLLEGQSATLLSASSENGVIKFKIDIGGRQYDSYATKNGKLIFPEGIVVEEVRDAPESGQNTQNTNQPSTNVTPATVAKADKSQLDVYVVSQCPYGIQMQRAIHNAVSKIPDLASNIKVRYIGAVAGNTITAMHGNEEAQENLRQICVREEQENKYWSYVGCYIKNGDAIGCQATAGIDADKLASCTQDPKRGVAYAQEDFNLNAQYGITGSPTLILNGAEVDETPFGGRSSDSMRNIICSSSQNPPDFCSQQLDTNQANTSFSLTYAN